MKVQRRKKLYCYAQSMAIKNNDKFSEYHPFGKNYRIRYIMSDHKLTFGNIYTDMREKGMTFSDWEKENWYPILEGIDDNCSISEITKNMGWQGLYNLLPNIIPGNYLEFVITVTYDDDECENIPEDNSENLIVTKPNFVSGFHFYVLNRWDDIMLGWGDDKPDYEFDDGSIKWDVCDRANSTLLYSHSTICGNSPISDLFAECKCDSHGIYIPYKADIDVEGFIKTNQE